MYNCHVPLTSPSFNLIFLFTCSGIAYKGSSPIGWLESRDGVLDVWLSRDLLWGSVPLKDVLSLVTWPLCSVIWLLGLVTWSLCLVTWPVGGMECRILSLVDSFSPFWVPAGFIPCVRDTSFSVESIQCVTMQLKEYYVTILVVIKRLPGSCYDTETRLRHIPN